MRPVNSISNVLWFCVVFLDEDRGHIECRIRAQRALQKLCRIEYQVVIVLLTESLDSLADVFPYRVREHAFAFIVSSFSIVLLAFEIACETSGLGAFCCESGLQSP